MRRFLFLSLALALILPCLSSCDDDDFPDSSPQQVTSPAKLKGIWKLIAVRYAGSNLTDVNTLYAIADPEEGNLALVTDITNDSETSDPVFDAMKMIVSHDSIILVRTEDYDEYLISPNKDISVKKMPFLMADDDNLDVYPMVTDFVDKESSAKMTEGKTLHLVFYRDTELERQVGISTKSIGAEYWMSDAILAICVKWTSTNTSTSPGSINVKDDFVMTKSWDNSLGWKAGNWMSLLPNDMPVAWVNIPGSHDSSTTEDNMNFIADMSDAWVQTYGINEQFNKGARYFDFRVGSELKPIYLGLYQRPLNEAERANTEELLMYHGPLCTNTPFYATMKDLANRVQEGGTEFIVINVQAESESDGLGDNIMFEIWSWFSDDGQEEKQQYKAAVNEQSMDIANRLMKKLSREFGDKIFIPYRPDLTVGEARGHIIIIQGDSNMHYQCKGLAYDWEGNLIDTNWLRASFCKGWPDNRTGYATLYTYELVDSIKNNMFVQSIYEMQVDDLDKINLKEKQIADLTKNVSINNADPNRMNIWGFNALNANNGSKTGLKTYYFAHEFNGFAYELFANNMLMQKDGAPVLRCGLVPMDHYGASIFDGDKDIKVYGDKLSWAVIESNFFPRRSEGTSSGN